MSELVTCDFLDIPHCKTTVCTNPVVAERPSSKQENKPPAPPTFVTFTGGGTSRSVAPDYTLVPKEAIEAIIRRMNYGIATGRERNNYQKSKDDPAFVRDRFNHMLNHIFRVMSGDGGSDDFDAILCNAAMLAWFRENGTGFEEVFPNAIKKDEVKNV